MNGRDNRVVGTSVRVPETIGAAALLEQFPSADTTSAVVLWHRADGLTEADTAVIGERTTALAAESTVPAAVGFLHGAG